MRLVSFVLACSLWGAAPVLAGAWLQQQGTGFFSLENALRRGPGGQSLETDVYLEYGLSQRLSGGLTLLQQAGRSGHVTLFLKTPLGRTGAGAVTAAQLDMGAYVDGLDWYGLSKLTIAHGRGFRWGEGHGWVNIDAAIEYRAGEPYPFFKLDGTIGRSTGAALRPMLKLSVTQARSKPLIWSLAPHLLIDGGDNLTWTLGLERKNDGTLSSALKLGIWRRF
jgi:hypothetical protein